MKSTLSVFRLRSRLQDLHRVHRGTEVTESPHKGECWPHGLWKKSRSLGIVVAEFPAGVKPILTLTSRVVTKNYDVDLSARGQAPNENAAELRYCLRATHLLPTDGIVKSTAMKITKGARTDLDKARAIYEWIVENTFRDPKTPGCGLGDIRFMLESKDLGGKCADLNGALRGSGARAGSLRAMFMGCA